MYLINRSLRDDCQLHSEHFADVLLKDGVDACAMFLVWCTSVREIFFLELWFSRMSKMADDDPWLLKEDGCLNVDTECKSIIYHANLNVLLITTGSAQVYVFDVNSGVILQRSSLSGKHVYRSPRQTQFSSMISRKPTALSHSLSPIRCLQNTVQ